MSVERVCVLGVKKFDFTPKGETTRLTGCKLTYVMGDVAEEEDRRGMIPITIPGAMEVYTQISGVPGMYDLELTQRPDGNGVAKLKLVSAKFIGHVRFAVDPVPGVEQSQRPTQIKPEQRAA